MEGLEFEERGDLCFVTFQGLPLGLLKVRGNDTVDPEFDRPKWLWTSEMVFWQLGGLHSTLDKVKEQIESNLTGYEAKFLRNYKKSPWKVGLRG